MINKSPPVFEFPTELPDITEGQRDCVKKVLGPILTKIFDPEMLWVSFYNGQYIYKIGDDRTFSRGAETPEEAWDNFLYELLCIRQEGHGGCVSEDILLPSGSHENPQITPGQIEALTNILGLDFIQAHPRYNPVHLAAVSRGGYPYYRLGALKFRDKKYPVQNWIEAWILMVDWLSCIRRRAATSVVIAQSETGQKIFDVMSQALDLGEDEE